MRSTKDLILNFIISKNIFVQTFVNLPKLNVFTEIYSFDNIFSTGLISYEVY